MIDDTESDEDRRYRLSNDKRVRALSKRIRKALDEVLTIAREEGIRRPIFFVECEGPTFHVMDGDHDGETRADLVDSGKRQGAIVFSLPDNMPPGSDVGAW